MKFRSIAVFPVSRYAVRAEKKLSHSHPARSRLGQSVNRSTAFCANVSRAASNTRLRPGSEQANAIAPA
jgi:hypothetical protein